MPNCYCKYCGTKRDSVAALVIGSCANSPSKKHGLYEGAEKRTYTCKYCGRTSGTIAGLTVGNCLKSPHKRHEPAM